MAPQSNSIVWGGAGAAGDDDWRKNKDGSYTATDKGDSTWSLYTQFGEADGFTAEEANAANIAQHGPNYRGADGGLKSDTEVGDTVVINTGASAGDDSTCSDDDCSEGSIASENNNTSEDNSGFDIGFTIWGENKVGDNAASSGVNNEEGMSKKSIGVNGSDINAFYTLLRHINTLGNGDINGVPIEFNSSRNTDPVLLFQFESNGTGNNPYVWIRGSSSIDSARADSARTMQNAKPPGRKRQGWALPNDAYDVDSIWIKSRSNNHK